MRVNVPRPRRGRYRASVGSRSRYTPDPHMQTTVEPLEENKVKLHIAVPADEFERALDAAFRKLAREVRIPGFRPGKAPRRLLEARLGTEGARRQALQDSLPDYYADAVENEQVDPIAAPSIEITAGQDEGDVEFDAVVEVRPVVRLVGYDELTVTLPWQDASDEDVDRQIDTLRERSAELADSDDPLTDGDYASIDIRGSVDREEVDGLVVSDFLYEVGNGNVVPSLDTQLHGAKPGAILEFTDELPERFGELGGKEAAFRVVVKEAKKKVLPDTTDEWVGEVSEFSTLDELRGDVRRRLELVARMQAQMAVRDRVLQAAADLVPVVPPAPLVESELEQRVSDLVHQLQHRGLTIEQYLAATGREVSDFVEEMREGAARAVLADLALRAVVAQEAIEASEDELDAEVERIAQRVEEKPARVRRDLEQRGVLEAVRSEIARGKALEFLVEHASVVDEAGAAIDLTLPEAAQSENETEVVQPSATEEIPEA
jgi:trigger factor